MLWSAACGIIMLVTVVVLRAFKIIFQRRS
jgi:hypothetical protein